MLKVTITIICNPDDSGWVPKVSHSLLHSLLLKAAREQKIPAVYQVNGPDGATAELIIEDMFEELEAEDLEQTKYIN